ncbi:Uncharacterised protein [Enterobacter cancerogenus]|uniref:Uncharacterized protein n=1 Tax=Enterobacter cancerogenus TaxID=69218 RepID=A0A484Z589_9ENTR|nr:Uncharacterised protein [Enterobacter cancerogenus]
MTLLSELLSQHDKQMLMRIMRVVKHKRLPASIPMFKQGC